MPNVSAISSLALMGCKLLIVRCDNSGDHSTAIVAVNEVIYFDPTGISYSDVQFFQNNYSIVREYAPGEKLVVTQ
jgi:hypothetical protein